MPGKRKGCGDWLAGLAIGGGAAGGNCEGVMTSRNRLMPLLNSRLSGCQVRRRQVSSAKLESESRLDQPLAFDTVGDASKVLWLGEKAPLLDVLIPGGPKRGFRTLAPCGDWNGLPPEGTLRRRPGVLTPAAYILCGRAWEEFGDAMPGAHRGLFCPVEKVADVGVPKSLGEAPR